MTYATKDDVQEVVNKAVEELSFVIQDLGKHIDDRFKLLVLAI